MTDILDSIDQMTIAGVLAESLPNGDIRCTACAHRCLIHPGKRGICKVRFNSAGILHVPQGYTAGIGLDPIEKKPFAHFIPGSAALTFGMLGCNFHCDFCQNWVTSQALRDDEAACLQGPLQRISAEQIVKTAIRSGASVIASSYNEPIITAEWAYSIFKPAKTAGLKTVMISNGYATKEALDLLRPVMDGYKIDLKSMREQNYRQMGAVLKHVVDSIHYAHSIGLWVEVVSLIIPEYNNSPEELWDMARTIAGISRDIPWHVTGFHPDYKMQDHTRTTSYDLQQAADVGQEAGLRYVYAGNLPGRVGSLENTYCPACQTLLIERRGYIVTQNKIANTGSCPDCGLAIPGVWSSSYEPVGD